MSPADSASGMRLRITCISLAPKRRCHRELLPQQTRHTWIVKRCSELLTISGRIKYVYIEHQQLLNSHNIIMNLSGLAQKIRKEKKLTREVPGFDPKNGNEKAKFLFLLEAPGPKAVESGIISFDNPDPSARHFGNQLAQAGIDRNEIAVWNIVPWYIGSEDGQAIRSATSADIQEGMKFIPQLLDSMPNLRCIVLVGGTARKTHIFLSRITTARILSCHHPSARVMNSNPNANEENIEIFRHMKNTSEIACDEQPANEFYTKDSGKESIPARPYKPKKLKDIRRIGNTETLKIGQVNRNNQIMRGLFGLTGGKGQVHLSYYMECMEAGCRHIYRVNACDARTCKCPICQTSDG